MDNMTVGQKNSGKYAQVLGGVGVVDQTGVYFAQEGCEELAIGVD
ncbi:hypothetical protein ABT075_02450 [Streptomyces sp. NPDC002677]